MVLAFVHGHIGAGLGPVRGTCVHVPTLIRTCPKVNSYSRSTHKPPIGDMHRQIRFTSFSQGSEVDLCHQSRHSVHTPSTGFLHMVVVWRGGIVNTSLRHWTKRHVDNRYLAPLVTEANLLNACLEFLGNSVGTFYLTFKMYITDCTFSFSAITARTCIFFRALRSTKTVLRLPNGYNINIGRFSSYAHSVTTVNPISFFSWPDQTGGISIVLVGPLLLFITCVFEFHFDSC
jgi:hypothetical protein